MGDQDPNFGCVSVSGPHCDGADSSERRNIEAMWRLRWELGGGKWPHPGLFDDGLASERIYSFT